MQIIIPATPLIADTRSFHGGELFTLSPAVAKTHRLATLWGRYTPSAAVKAAIGRGFLGPGIYACFYRSQCFYIGTYAGKGCPRRGNVIRERWLKHILGMTFRGKIVGMAKTRIAEIHAAGIAGELVDAVLDAAEAMIKTDGLRTHFKKFMFAHRHWDAFRGLTNADLSDFSFIYVPVALDGPTAIYTKEDVNPLLLTVEAAAIAKFNPPCNGASNNATGIPQGSTQDVAAFIHAELRKVLEARAAGSPLA